MRERLALNSHFMGTLKTFLLFTSLDRATQDR